MLVGRVQQGAVRVVVWIGGGPVVLWYAGEVDTVVVVFRIFGVERSIMRVNRCI